VGSLFLGINIEVDLGRLAPDAIDRLKALLAAHRGSTGVNLTILTPDKRRHLGRLPGDYNVGISNEFIEALAGLVGPGKFSVELRPDERSRPRRRWEESQAGQG
jgi:hypothetical protein